MAGVSEEEIVEIANNFLLNSPPGEFMEVVTDVRALLSNESLINESAPRTFREYNTEQMLIVDSPKGHKVLITKYGEVSDGEYLDPHGGQVLSFDHIKQEVTGARAIAGELDGSMESLRQGYEKATLEYVAEYYPHGAATVYAKDGQITIALSSAKFNPNNFWNGRWRSVWTIHGSEVVGHFKIQVHYYEDGNVQLNTDTTQKVPGVSENDPVGVLKAISRAEQAYQQALEKSYKSMGDTTFKALRRALPITRVKIDWNKIRAYKLGGEMSQKA